MRKTILLSLQALLLSTALSFTAGKNIYAQPVIGFNNFIVSGLSSPVDLTNARDGTNRLFIVEQVGRIRIHNGTLLITPFLNITSIVLSGGERGLLSLAFHPNYAINRYFFVYYTNLSGDITIARYQTQAANPNLADGASGVVLMTIPKPFANHNGGDLNFGPEGYLYFGTGDGGSGGDPNNFAQNGLSLLGKMIRIDVNNFLTPPYYTIPPDNPYTSNPNVDDHIWAIGLRNPWKWSFDRANNNMWIADVGQGAWEEVNFRTAGNTGGINYGWRCYEGNAPYNTTGCLPQNNYISPIFVYPHSFATGGFSITGGFVYRGPEYPVLQGYYICADYVSGNVWLINPNGIGWTTRMQTGLPGSISAFGESENGTLYAVSLGGNIYKVDVTTVLPLSLLSFSGTKQSGFNELKWNVAASQNVNRFIVEYSSNGSSWNIAGEVAAVNQAGNQQYIFRHYTTETGKLFYRLQIEENDGTSRYSPVISINGKNDAGIKVYPTLLTNNNMLQVVAEKEVTGIKIMDSYGRLVLERQMNGQQGYFTVSLPELSRGLYWVQVLTRSGNETVKIIIE